MSAAGPKLSLGETFRGLVRTCGEQWRLLLVAGLVVFIPIGFLEALDERVGDVDVDHISDLVAVEAVLVGLVHTATALWGDIFYTGVVAAGVSEMRGGERRTLGHIARVLPYRRLVGIDILYTLIVLAGLVLLVVPGVIFFVWFSLAGVVVKVEGKGVVDSLRRSRELVRGSFWRVFAIVVPAELLSSAIIDAGRGIGHDVVDGFAGEWLGATVGEMLATPLYAVAVVVVTYELIALDSRS